MAWEPTVFWIQKEGEPPESYEDAFAPGGGMSRRFAVSDGATNGHWSKRLADRLVQNWTEDTTLPVIIKADPDVTSDRSEGRCQWHDALIQDWLAYALERKEEAPWSIRGFQDRKIAEGPGATLLLLEFGPDDLQEWQAMSLGDCCLLQIRDGDLIASLPWQPGDSPTPAPHMITRYSWPATQEVSLCGFAERKDVFLLTSDALAEWIFTDPEDRIDVSGAETDCREYTEARPLHAHMDADEWDGSEGDLGANAPEEPLDQMLPSETVALLRDLSGGESGLPNPDERSTEIRARLQALLSLIDETAFVKFVQTQRACTGLCGRHGMRNDDVTLMVVRWAGPH